MKVKHCINIKERKFCFEIFGYDFIIDSLFNVYLLEVNSNPGLELSSPIIRQLVPRMIDDCLRLTIDKVFKTIYTFNSEDRENNRYQSPFRVNGYNSEENLW